MGKQCRAVWLYSVLLPTFSQLASVGFVIAAASLTLQAKFTLLADDETFSTGLENVW